MRAATSRAALGGTALVLGVATVIVPSRAMGQSAVRCSTPYLTAIVNRMGIDSNSLFPTDPFDQGNVGSARRYGHQIHHARRFIANKYVNAVTFDMPTFSTELNFDYVDIYGCPASGCSTFHHLTGSLGSISKTVTYSAGGASSSFQSAPLSVRFHTDYSVSAIGVDLFSASVGCYPSPYSNDSVSIWSPGEAGDGVVLGPDDIVYFALPGGETGSQKEYGVTLATPYANTGVDLDLLAACGRRPTLYDKDAYSQTAGNYEYLDLTTPCASTWIVGVHSYPHPGMTGQGPFRLHAAERYVSERTQLRAGIVANMSCDGAPVSLATQQARWNNAVSWLKAASRALYGATDGQQKISFELTNVTSVATRDTRPTVLNGVACSASTPCSTGTCDLSAGQCSVPNEYYNGDIEGGNMMDEVRPGLTPSQDLWLCGSAHDKKCDLRLSLCHFGGQTSADRKYFFIGNQWTTAVDGYDILHEYGHMRFKLEDFYAGVSGGALPGDYPAGANTILGFAACGHSVMGHGHSDHAKHHFCTSYNHYYNPRWVSNCPGSNEDSLLDDTFGRFVGGTYTCPYPSIDVHPGIGPSPGPSTLGYRQYFGALNFSGYTISYSPWAHSTYFDRGNGINSDWKNGINVTEDDVGIHRLFMEPPGFGSVPVGSDDPYRYVEFDQTPGWSSGSVLPGPVSQVGAP